MTDNKDMLSAQLRATEQQKSGGGGEEEELSFASDRVKALVICPASGNVVATHHSGLIQVLDPGSSFETIVSTTLPHAVAVRAAAFVGNYLVVGDDAFTLTVLDPVTLAVVLSHEDAHGDYIRSIGLDPVHPRRFVTAGDDLLAHVWELAADGTALTRLCTLEGAEHYVMGAAFNSAGTAIATASLDQRLRIYAVPATLEPGAPVSRIAPRLSLTGHAKGINCVAWMPGTDVVATGSDDTTVRVWDGASGAALETVALHRHNVSTIAWARNGSCTLFSAGEDALVAATTFTGPEAWGATGTTVMSEATGGRVWALVERVNGDLVAGCDRGGLCLTSETWASPGQTHAAGGAGAATGGGRAAVDPSDNDRVDQVDGVAARSPHVWVPDKTRGSCWHTVMLIVGIVVAAFVAASAAAYSGKSLW